MKDHYIRVGKIDDAIQLFEDDFPALLNGQGLEVDEQNVWLAVNLAGVLQRADRYIEANTLLDGALEYVEQNVQDNFPGQLVFKAAIHSLMGDKSSAHAALRRAIDAGWRYAWFYQLELNPNFDQIRNESEFQAMTAEVRADMADQLAKVRAGKESEP